MSERHAAENDEPRRRVIRCDDIDALCDAQVIGEAVEVEHVCDSALRHAGQLDDLIDFLTADIDPMDETIRQALWEDAVERGEPWAMRDYPPASTQGEPA